MACCYEYTDRQRVAFYAVGVGLALCIVGCATPFWLSGKVVTDKTSIYLTHNLAHTGSAKTIDISIGLWWYCLGFEGHEQICFTYTPRGHYEAQPHGLLGQDDSPSYVLCVRMLMCGCLLTALVGLLTVCFYCSSCCSNGRTLGYGLLFFVAGVLGFAAVFILTFKVDVLLSIPESHTTFGWSFPVFVTGNSLILLASLVLCIPHSKKFWNYETMVTVDIPKHELTGQMGAFEALPEPRSLRICKTDI